MIKGKGAKAYLNRLLYLHTREANKDDLLHMEEMLLATRRVPTQAEVEHSRSAWHMAHGAIPPAMHYNWVR